MMLIFATTKNSLTAVVIAIDNRNTLANTKLSTSYRSLATS